MKSPVQAEDQYIRKIRCTMEGCDVDRTKVGKPVSQLSRKAAIAHIVPVP